MGYGCPTVHIGSYARFSEHQFDWAIYPQPSGAQLRRCHALFGCRRPAGHADTPLDDQQAMLGLHQTHCFMLLLDHVNAREGTQPSAGVPSSLLRLLSVLSSAGVAQAASGADADCSMVFASLLSLSCVVAVSPCNALQGRGFFTLGAVHPPLH